MAENSGSSAGGGSIVSFIVGVVSAYIALNQGVFLAWAAGVAAPWTTPATIVVWVLTVYGALFILMWGILILGLVVLGIVVIAGHLSGGTSKALGADDLEDE